MLIYKTTNNPCSTDEPTKAHISRGVRYIVVYQKSGLFVGLANLVKFLQPKSISAQLFGMVVEKFSAISVKNGISA